MKNLKMGLTTGAMLLTLAAFQNCGHVNFAAKDDGSTGALATPDPLPPVTPSPTPQVICDPFSAANNIAPNMGIEGRLYSSPNRLPAASCADGHTCTSRDYIGSGTMANAQLFLSEIFVPTRDFSQGFDVAGQGKLLDPNGNVLVEWFALDTKSNFTLSAADEDGEYQFAAISDDGVTLTVNGQDILVDEGEHAPRLSCSASTVSLKKGDLLPFRFTYFQGPRTQIAAVLMWRKVMNGNVADCGTSDGVLPSQTDLPVPLSSRGWKVIQPQNYILTDGYNLCSKK